LSGKNTFSNDFCAAGLHQFIAVVANVLYSLKGDLCSFLAQSKMIKPSLIPSIYSLHVKDGLPEAIDKLEDIRILTNDLVLNSEYPTTIKKEWTVFVQFLDSFLRAIEMHKVCSEPQHYVDSAERLLETVNSLLKLADSFSTNVEIVTMEDNIERGLDQLKECDDIFNESQKLAEYWKELTDQKMKERTQ
jgi:hypothetical protein